MGDETLFKITGDEIKEIHELSKEQGGNFAKAQRIGWILKNVVERSV